MLPGFRFLLAAIALSVSILIFGLGAAALLRAAHEEFASIPGRRVTPEPVFAQQQGETAAPTLALLRVEVAPQESASPASSAPIREEETAPEAVPVPKVDSEKLAALQMDDAAAAEETTPVSVTAAAPASEPAVAEPPAEVKVAATDAAPIPSASIETTPTPQVEATPAPAEPITTPAMTDGTSKASTKAATKTAALGNASKAIEDPAQAKKTAAKPDRSEIKKKERADRAKERRRLAARRARLAAAQQAATTAAQQPDLFPVQTQPAQPTVAKRKR